MIAKPSPRILIISRRDLALTPYHAWLASTGAHLSLISTEKYLQSGSHLLGRYAHIYCYPTGQTAAVFHSIVDKHIARHGVDTVVAFSESDLLRAAQIRDRYQLSGQSVASARVFRDKVFMKRRYRASGLRTPAFRVVNSNEDITRFMQEFPGPSVLKPRRSSASRGIIRVDSPDVVPTILEERFPNGFAQNCWFMERFIDGRKFHIDGVVKGGSATAMLVSEYLFPPLDFVTGKPGGSMMINQTSPLARQLRAVGSTMIAALPFPETAVFHLDIYLNRENGRYYCGEVAARPAGNRITEVYEHATGVNLERWFLQETLQISPSRASVSTHRLHNFFGNIHIRRVPGTISALPEVTQNDFMVSPQFSGEVGSTIIPAHSSIANIWSCLCQADTEEALRERCYWLAEVAQDACQRVIIEQ